jgi:hypothetical protein
VEIQSFSLLDKLKWEDAVRGIPHTVYQSWSYCNALQKSQTVPIQMLCIDGNNSGLVAVYCKRSKDNENFDIYSPYGFGGMLFWGTQDDLILNAFECWLIKNKIVTAYLMAHPVLGHGNQLIGHRTSFVLDLTRSEQELWLALGSGHKYELKKNLKDNSISITDDKHEIMEVLPLLYRNTLNRVGASNAYYFNEETLNDLVFHENTMVLGAKIDGIIHATIMINYAESVAEYFINATDEIGRNLTRLLLWVGINRLRANEIRLFNLGGGAHEGDQLEAFKRRMGGKQVSIPLYRKIVDTLQYKKLCEHFGSDPNDLSYFPSYWKK